MSVAHILEALGIEAVTPVPSEASPKGTEKAQTKHGCSLRSLRSLRSPKKHVAAKTQREHIHPTLRQLQEPVDPDTLLQDIAETLQASHARLRRLLDADDLQDIAEGATSRAHLLTYFRLMRSDGHQLANDPTEATTAPESRSGQVERVQAWEPSRDNMINHLMLCKRCYAPRKRYCPEGQQLRENYHAAYENSKELPSTALALPKPTK